jgi:hypothetical protein
MFVVVERKLRLLARSAFSTNQDQSSGEEHAHNQEYDESDDEVRNSRTQRVLTELRVITHSEPVDYVHVNERGVLCKKNVECEKVEGEECWLAGWVLFDGLWDSTSGSSQKEAYESPKEWTQRVIRKEWLITPTAR